VHELSLVSNAFVRRIRFAVLLPLLHLSILAAPMFHEERQVWRNIPMAQAAEDWEQKWREEHPGGSGEPELSPCYEYRFSNAARLIFIANVPATIAFGVSSSDCPESLLRAIVRPSRYHVRVKIRVLVAEILVVSAILLQWWLIGRWLDRRRRRLKSIRLSILAVAVITMCGIVMLPTIAFSGPSRAELVNILSGMLALLAWFLLLVGFAVFGIQWLARKLRRESARVIAKD
jgi:hypothetical protein